MVTLILDTAFDYLAIGLVKDDKILINYQELAAKKQSEITLSTLDNLLKEIDFNKQEIDNILITIGPGSYTGLRISVTIAKVLAKFGTKNLYTLDTLKAYSPLDHQIHTVLMDARSNRYYVAKYYDQLTLIKPCVLTLDQLETIQLDNPIGNHPLSQSPKIIQSMVSQQKNWQKN